MARVQINKTGGKQYVQVVEYWTDPQGQRHTKVLRSFGALSGDSAADAEKMGQARSFAASVDAAKGFIDDLLNKGEGWELIRSVLTVVFGFLLGAAVLTFLLSLFQEEE